MRPEAKAAEDITLLLCDGEKGWAFAWRGEPLAPTAEKIIAKANAAHYLPILRIAVQCMASNKCGYLLGEIHTLESEIARLESDAKEK